MYKGFLLGSNGIRN
ncbi:hypothetical protein ACS0PU_007132, partial [Formica fusca]